jgi:acetyl esterase/lipase
MNFSQIDEELLLALDSFPELDIWTDLRRRGASGKEMRQKIVGQIPPVEGVQHADYVLPQDDGHDLIFRVYRPDSQIDPLPALLWMHGGGYCLGAMENDDYIVRQFVKETGLHNGLGRLSTRTRMSLPYRLNDCYAVLAWIADHSQELAIDRIENCCRWCERRRRPCSVAGALCARSFGYQARFSVLAVPNDRRSQRYIITVSS